jgi:hypothetical protein
VAHLVLRGVAYAWDVPDYTQTGSISLPDPSDPSRRLLVVSEPAVAQIALDRILGVLLPALEANPDRLRPGRVLAVER